MGERGFHNKALQLTPQNGAAERKGYVAMAHIQEMTGNVFSAAGPESARAFKHMPPLLTGSASPNQLGPIVLMDEVGAER